MRNTLSVALECVAAFFVFGVILVSFVSGVPTAGRLGVMLFFLIPALIALIGGLALKQYRDWKRHTGLVLLGASGFGALSVLNFACIAMTDGIRNLMNPDTLAFFGDYLTGGATIVGLGVSGWACLRAGGTRSEPRSAESREPGGPAPRA